MIHIPNIDVLLQENAILSKELGKLQERSNRLLAEKSKEIELLRSQMALKPPAPKSARIGWLEWLDSFFHLIGNTMNNTQKGHKGV